MKLRHGEIRDGGCVHIYISPEQIGSALNLITDMGCKPYEKRQVDAIARQVNADRINLFDFRAACKAISQTWTYPNAPQYARIRQHIIAVKRSKAKTSEITATKLPVSECIQSTLEEWVQDPRRPYPFYDQEHFEETITGADIDFKVYNWHLRNFWDYICDGYRYKGVIPPPFPKDAPTRLPSGPSFRYETV